MIFVSGAPTMVNHTWATHHTKVITAVEEEVVEVVEVMGEGLIVQWPTSWDI